VSIQKPFVALAVDSGLSTSRISTLHASANFPAGAASGQFSATVLSNDVPALKDFLQGSDALALVYGYRSETGQVTEAATIKAPNIGVILQEELTPEGAALTVTVPDLFGTRYKLAPRLEADTWWPGEDERMLGNFLEWVYFKLGFFEVKMSSTFRGVRLERPIIIEPTDTYHGVAQSLIAPFQPIFYDDPIGNKVYILDIDGDIEGAQSFTITPSRHIKVETLPTEEFPRVDQVELRYAGSVEGGGPGEYDTDCPPLISQVAAPILALPGGDRLLLNLNLCGGFTLPGSRLLEGGAVARNDEVRQPLPDGGIAQFTRVYAAWTEEDADGNERTVRTEPIRTIARYWPATGPDALQLAAETSTEFYYQPGSNLTQLSGKIITTSGRVDIPGAGRAYVSPVSVRKEWVTLERRTLDPVDQWREIGRGQTERGLLLMPDKVPVNVGTLNGVIDTSTSTRQYLDTGTDDAMPLLRARLEFPTSAGTNVLETTIMDYDHQRGSWDISTTERGYGGAISRETGGGYLSERFARTGDDPMRQMVVLDFTAFGAAGYDLGVELKDKLFARSGDPLERARVTAGVPLGKVRRGMLLNVPPRVGGVNPTEGFVSRMTVEGFSLSFTDIRRDGSCTVETVIDGVKRQP
jgi:hypothetical protein